MRVPTLQIERETRKRTIYGIIRLVSISPWRGTFIGIVAPDVTRKRKGTNERIASKVRPENGRAPSRFQKRRPPLSLIRFALRAPLSRLPPSPPPLPKFSIATFATVVRVRVATELPFSAETRLLDDFRQPGRINAVKLNPNRD